MTFTFSPFRPTVQAVVKNPRYRLLWLLAGLLLPSLACGLFSPQYYLNNDVRLAVYNYEEAQRGPVDDLVLAFNRSEPRIKFEGQQKNGGRTVWLYDQAAREYFALHRPETTFMYLQKIEYFDNYRRAIVTVYRGDSQGYVGRELTLAKGASSGQWLVTNEVLVDSGQARTSGN